MADEQRRSGHEGRGGFQRRQEWRDSRGRDDRREGGFGRGRDFNERGRGERSGFGGRDERRAGGYGRGRDDRREGGFGNRRDGERRFDRDSNRSYGERSDRRGDSRDFNARGDRREGGFNRGRDDRRDDRREGGFNRGRDFNERGRGERSGFGGRDDRRAGGFNRGRDERRNERRDDRREGGFGNRRDGERRFDRDSNRSYGERSDRRGDSRDFNARGDRREGGFNRGRDDRRDDRREGGFNRGRDFNERGRGERSGFGGRDDRRAGGFNRGRDDRRNERRDDRREGGFGQRREGGFAGGRDERRGPRREDSDYQNFSSTEEYISPNPDEPTIPAGVSAEELDANALRALNTLSGPNKDIVARHLVMAGQLIDLDPEEAYKHAAAASSRAGRVDVVREAAALTAYASGRYEEALREVRAVRRMRGDDSLRAVEADCERGLGRPEKAIEIIDATTTKGMELSEQVELILVSSGARADLGENEVGLLIVDDALAALPADTDPELLRRLMEVKIDRLRELGRESEADEVEANLPEEIEDTEIVDLSLFADCDVDNKRTALRGTETPLVELFDAVLLDLDGTSWNGDSPLEHAAPSVVEARAQGMKTVFLTNNAMRTPEQVADKLNSMDFEADASMVMTSAMDVVAIMKESIEDGSKVFVIGGSGVRQALENAGYVLVDSADDEPVAVVQGLDKSIDWAMLSEGAFAIQRGAAYFATNLDATLPQERGFALGNGSLVRAISHATHTRPIAAGKPEPGIYLRGAALVDSEKPIAVGDRLETDIAGAVSAGIPSLHVLTGVHGAREVILAQRGQRPSFLALDMRGLLEEHPRAKHHRDNTWTCGESQVVKATRYGTLLVDDVELEAEESYTVTLDTYRALAAAAWDYADESGRAPRCATITVVENGDPSGVIEAPVVLNEADEKAQGEEFDAADAELSSEADGLDPALDTPAFLPGEEELERLLAETEEGVESDDFAQAAEVQEPQEEQSSEDEAEAALAVEPEASEAEGEAESEKAGAKGVKETGNEAADNERVTPEVEAEPEEAPAEAEPEEVPAEAEPEEALAQAELLLETQDELLSIPEIEKNEESEEKPEKSSGDELE